MEAVRKGGDQGDDTKGLGHPDIWLLRHSWMMDLLPFVTKERITFSPFGLLGPCKPYHQKAVMRLDHTFDKC